MISLESRIFFVFASPQAQAHITSTWVITLTSYLISWPQFVLNAVSREHHQERATDLVRPLLETIV